jgi:transposase
MMTVSMDSHTHSALVSRLEVVDSGRRRRWSDEEKLKIVLESLAAPRQVSATARRYGIARSQLLQWRRLFRPERNESVEQASGFVPAVVVPEAELARSAPAGLAVEGTIEIEFASGARIRVTGAVDSAALKAAVEALSGGKPR